MNNLDKSPKWTLSLNSEIANHILSLRMLHTYGYRPPIKTQTSKQLFPNRSARHHLKSRVKTALFHTVLFLFSESHTRLKIISNNFGVYFQRRFSRNRSVLAPHCGSFHCALATRCHCSLFHTRLHISHQQKRSYRTVVAQMCYVLSWSTTFRDCFSLLLSNF